MPSPSTYQVQGFTISFNFPWVIFAKEGKEQRYSMARLRIQEARTLDPYQVEDDRESAAGAVANTSFSFL